MGNIHTKILNSIVEQVKGMISEAGHIHIDPTVMLAYSKKEQGKTVFDILIYDAGYLMETEFASHTRYKWDLYSEGFELGVEVNEKYEFNNVDPIGIAFICPSYVLCGTDDGNRKDGLDLHYISLKEHEKEPFKKSLTFTYSSDNTVVTDEISNQNYPPEYDEFIRGYKKSFSDD